MSFDINNVEEIQVRYADGNEVIYRGNGLEKFRRMVLTSPALGEVEPVSTTIVVDTDDSDVDESNVVPQKKSSKKPSKKASAPAKATSANGYATADLNYAPAKGMSAMDMAKEMQRQAEKISGINFA